jgi:hypothetical protein
MKVPSTMIPATKRNSDLEIWDGVSIALTLIHRVGDAQVTGKRA